MGELIVLLLQFLFDSKLHLGPKQQGGKEEEREALYHQAGWTKYLFPHLALLRASSIYFLFFMSYFVGSSDGLL